MIGREHYAAGRSLLERLRFRVGHPRWDAAGGADPIPCSHFKTPYFEGDGYLAFVRFDAAWPVACLDDPLKRFVIAQRAGLTPEEPVFPVAELRRFGKGLVLVIGDSGFALNKNLEREDGDLIEGLRENADFWRWLLPFLRAGEVRLDSARPGSGGTGCDAGGSTMILAWIGLALLSASWLFAIGYFTPPNLPLSWLVAHFGGTWDAWPDPLLWPLLIGAAVVCLAMSQVSSAHRRSATLPNAVAAHAASPQPVRPASPLGLIASAIAFFLCLPALIVMPWPYRSGPLLLAVGLVLNMAVVSAANSGRSEADAPRSSVRTRWLWERLANAALLAGCVVVVQGVALEWYQAAHLLQPRSALASGGAGRSGRPLAGDRPGGRRYDAGAPLDAEGPPVGCDLGAAARSRVAGPVRRRAGSACLAMSPVPAGPGKVGSLDVRRVGIGSAAGLLAARS